jgi:hypothetical protein
VQSAQYWTEDFPGNGTIDPIGFNMNDGSQYGYDYDQNFPFYVMPDFIGSVAVPEPSSALLVVPALMALVVRRKRRA